MTIAVHRVGLCGDATESVTFELIPLGWIVMGVEFVLVATLFGAYALQAARTS